MLWIALYLPQLPLQLVQRIGAPQHPCVIADGPMLRPLVYCASDSARERGIKLDMPVAAARALAGELAVLPRDVVLLAGELRAPFGIRFDDLVGARRARRRCALGHEDVAFIVLSVTSRARGLHYDGPDRGLREPNRFKSLCCLVPVAGCSWRPGRTHGKV